MKKLGKRGFVAASVALLAALGVATVVKAAIPDSQGKIDACYYTPGKLASTNPRPGTLRVIDTDKGQQCASDETPLSWDASNGLSNQTQVSAFSSIHFGAAAGTVVTATAQCPEGTHLVSGGGDVADVLEFEGPSYNSDVVMVASKGDPTEGTWTVTGVTTAQFGQLHFPAATAYANCT